MDFGKSFRKRKSRVTADKLSCFYFDSDVSLLSEIYFTYFKLRGNEHVLHLVSF